MRELARLSAALEIKYAGAEPGTFSGYGAVFGNVDSHGDVIEKGAFRDTLREAKASGRWPAMLLQHGGPVSEDMTPIGIWTNLAEDEKGLRVEGKLAIETSRGRDIYTLMTMKPRPAISELSIGYRAKDFERGTRPGQPVRRLKSVELFEVSLVTMAANPKARISDIKSSSDITRERIERDLRGLGYPNRAAKRIAAGWRNVADDETAEELEAIKAASAEFAKLFDLFRKES